MFDEQCWRMCRIVSWGFIVHIVLLVSVFDVHFRSPVLENVNPVDNDLIPPADRLVLFVGDGIRADKFFELENGYSNVPYLRSIIETTGVWGISNTHVPTESRPGHVAIIAGMYEDPSAIFKGWQNYVVDFDSVLNRSESSFSWGSPDILNIFSQGSKKDNAYFHSYSAEMQQFSGVNSSDIALTYWVADQFEEFLNDLVQNEELAKVVRRKGTVFFFHFLGTDIAGHTFKPHSLEYKDNIKAVDSCVYRIQRAINDYFDDNRTSFIFTSDHGMTDWGSHGGGTDAETLTPIVAWGAGLNGPQFKEFEFVYSNVSMEPHVLQKVVTSKPIPDEWELSNFHRYDIDQVDIAPLMSVLIGISIPTNSKGILPIQFLIENPLWTLKALTLNAAQLKAQFKVVHDKIKLNLFNYFYKEFYEPNMDELLPDKSRSNLYEMVILAVEACMRYNEGIEFYRKYYSPFLLSLLSFIFIGWILNLCFEIISRSKIGRVIFPSKFRCFKLIECWNDEARNFMIALSVLSLALLTIQNLPLNFYAYVCLAIVLWWKIIPPLKQVIRSFSLLKTNCWVLFKYCVLFIAGLECLVLSFQSRGCMCGAVYVLTFFWFIEQECCFNVRKELLLWLVSTSVMSVFPMMSSIGGYKNMALVVGSGSIWLLLRLLVVYLSNEERTLTSGIQVFLIFIAICNALIIDLNFSLKKGLSLANQIVSWIVLGSSILMLKRRHNMLHLSYINIGCCLCAPFLLLSIAQEVLFLVFLFVHLYIWIMLEYFAFKERMKIDSDQARLGPNFLKYSSFRLAFFFLVYVLLSFFGLGNITSLNSFDPAWTRAFITMFSPFTMMTLIIFKTVIPIFLVTCALRVIISICQESAEIIFCIVLLFCDVMCLQFYLLVTTEGSWLDIGTSLTQFILMEALTILLLIFYGIAMAVMHKKKRKIQDCYLAELEHTLTFSFNIFK